jgi:hypothetical protein
VFVLHPKDRNRAKTIAAVVRGAIVENFECEIEGTPCEVLTGAPDHVVTDQLMEIYPAFQIGGLKPRACVGRRLDDSAGDAIGMLILLFEERLQESEFAVSPPARARSWNGRRTTPGCANRRLSWSAPTTPSSCARWISG